ncbi:MAG: oligosaccharide flippase family protein [Candidatus Curtissbacteria bacterium]|nr:oligosaccharide flippase family protein [Candidatus Curtissbacteria bacterium]
MLTKFKNLLFTKTGKDTGIVLAGTVINVIAGGLFFVIAPRLLGPGDFGIFSTVVGTCLLAVSISSFGIDTGILKFATRTSPNAPFILSVALKSYLVIGATVAIVGVSVAPLIANLLGEPHITPYLRIGFAGVIFILLTNFFVAALQARQEFFKASLITISANLSRLLVLAIGAYFFMINLYFLTALYFFITVISIIVGKSQLSFSIKKFDKNIASGFFKYNSWIGASMAIASIPLDNYFLLKFAGPTETGLYAAPYKLLTVAYQFGGNYTSVLASRFASMQSKEGVIIFSKKAAILIALFSIGVLGLAILAKPLILVVFGNNYAGSVRVFQILSIGFIFFFASIIPSSIILYYLGKSNISFRITALRVGVFICALMFLVPKYKAIGGAWAFTLSEAIVFLTLCLYLIINLAKRK